MTTSRMGGNINSRLNLSVLVLFLDKRAGLSLQRSPPLVEGNGVFDESKVA